MTDNQQIAHRDQASGGAVSIPVDQQMAMMNEALTNPNVDPAKAREMFALMREMMNDAKQAEFNRDKIAAKDAMPAIYKRGYNSHQKTKHVLFEDMQRAIDPVLHRFNLMLDFDLSRIPGGDIQVIPILRHNNGWIERGGPLSGPPDEGPGRSKIQSIGSSGSYLKRYATEAFLNLVRDGEDNDGAIREGSLLNDRQDGVVVDAQAAFDNGTYAEWFSRQSTKDKALLVQIGLHATLGGGRLLPGSERPPARDPEPVAQSAQERPKPAERQPEPKPGGNHDVSTPDGWAAQYVDDCDAARDMDMLNRIATKGAGGLSKLSDGHPKLWEKCDFAMLEARDRLKGDA